MTARYEHDSAGETEIPVDRYWGAQTARAMAHFPQVGPRIPIAVTRALGWQKTAAARANLALGVLDEERAELIEQAALEVAGGAFDEHFPLSVWQTGSGTQTNMCANEIIANRANEIAGQPLGTRSPVHPNDHVNRSQSSNDTFPSVMHVAAVLEVEQALLPAVDALNACLARQRERHGSVVRIGRTHLNDAVPVRLAQNFLGWEASVSSARQRIAAGLGDLRLLAQGGTAAGSGLNAPPSFSEKFCDELNTLLGSRFEPHPVKVESMAAHDALAALSAALKGMAMTLMRLANDIRHLASGPRAGLGEILLADDGLSSSIMPGKRNATQAEAMLQVAYRVIGNDATITAANSSSLFELNVAKPVIILALLESVDLLSAAIPHFADFIEGIEPNVERMASNIEMSLMLATALTPDVGYDGVAQITRTADRTGQSLREVVEQTQMISPERFAELVDPAAMADAGQAKK